MQKYNNPKKILVLGGSVLAVAMGLILAPTRQVRLDDIPARPDLPISEKIVVTPAPPAPAATPPKPISDAALLVLIKAAVMKQNNGQLDISKATAMHITEKADLTGDNVPEYLIDLGAGGAATDSYAIVKVENNAPILPSFKEGNGKVSWAPLLSGTGGGGRYSSTFVLDAVNHAVYIKSFSLYGDSTDYCSGKAYKWNESTGQFEYDQVLSAEPQKDINAMCAKVKSAT